ncbi:hypothetical protein RM780_04500 [Streptomyces sp. DSM 44917]|uniref:Leucine-binding protein domain-containing protein n=1 Tax=Streptomyces boetiae TaxID=3075541 RepID=A0ABU2L3X9_9ACTN|nr:hypothetical protein [Streptomyces sp. DSM 44917]MDT0306222.1 hypothetical protein [Streptomyces sp. DSM 44917]
MTPTSRTGRTPGSRPGRNPFEPPGRRVRKAVAVLLAAALAAGLGVLGVRALLAEGGCPGGQTREGGQCLGVTDGSHPFLPTAGGEALGERFRQVQERILTENERVAAGPDRSVKVGLLATLTPDGEGPQSPERVLHALEGAYTAQMRANHTRELGDPAPLIQLYLANAGARHERWQAAVDGLVELADGPQPLVAVVGLSISTEASRAAALELSGHGIPVVASSASGDQLNSGEVPGLVRVTATNTDFVNALRTYVAGREELREAVLVHDTQAPDLHVHSLTEAFRTVMAEQIGSNPEQPFEGTTTEESPRPALVDAAVQNTCAMGADMVLFAGRTHDLDTFLEALGNRSCREDPISVLFVETGPVIAEHRWPDLTAGRITVVQASAMDPAWLREEGTGTAPEGFAAFRARFGEYVASDGDAAGAGAETPEEGLADGYAAANHDALAVAVRALRLAHVQDPDAELTGAWVRDAFFLLHLDNAVRGASGTLSYTSGGEGAPAGKPVALIEAPPGPEPPPPYITPDR